mgnify:CR=1 FL=1
MAPEGLSFASSAGPAVMVLEDGRAFGGQGFAAPGTAFGEAVFATGMTGYQETLTDPSYHRQVVVMTAPHIGNTGINDEDDESRRVWVSAFVVRDLAPRPSNWRSRRSLESELADQGVVGLTGVDTRAVTRHLRDRGAMRAGVFTDETARLPLEALLEQVRDQPAMTGADLTSEVTCAAPYRVGAVGHPRFSVAAIDLGIKRATPRLMAERGMDVTVMPADITIETLLAERPDGVFFSNGPGDPGTARHATALMSALLEREVPVFGICFGNQVLGRALGLHTYKLGFGHRGINQPVQDLRTGRVAITAHNHGFAVDAPIDGSFATRFGAAEVSHLGLNDRVVEGLRCLDVPAFSVQYHPEAAAGPHDAVGLFDEFAALMSRHGGR